MSKISKILLSMIISISCGNTTDKKQIGLEHTNLLELYGSKKQLGSVNKQPQQVTNNIKILQNINFIAGNNTFISNNNIEKINTNAKETKPAKFLCKKKVLNDKHDFSLDDIYETNISEKYKPYITKELIQNSINRLEQEFKVINQDINKNNYYKKCNKINVVCTTLINGLLKQLSISDRDYITVAIRNIFFNYYRNRQDYKIDVHAVTVYAKNHSVKKTEEQIYKKKLGDFKKDIKRYNLLSWFLRDDATQYNEIRNTGLKQCTPEFRAKFETFSKPYLDLIQNKLWNELIINKKYFKSDKDKEAFINGYVAKILQENNNLNNENLYYDTLKEIVERCLSYKTREKTSKNNNNDKLIKPISVDNNDGENTNNHIIQEENRFAKPSPVIKDNKIRLVNNNQNNLLPIQTKSTNTAPQKKDTEIQTDIAGTDVIIIQMP